MVLNRIRNWFKERAKCKQLRKSFDLLNLKYRNAKEIKYQLEEKVVFLLNQANGRKMLQVVQIMTEYENSIKHPITDGIRIEKMDNTLQQLCKVIAGKNDTLVFWRVNERLLKEDFRSEFYG